MGLSLRNIGKKIEDIWTGGSNTAPAAKPAPVPVSHSIIGADWSTPQAAQRTVAAMPPSTRPAPVDFYANLHNPDPNFHKDPLAPANFYTAGILGVGRSGVGTAQGLSGLYDLATPGKGTNRFSKSLDRTAKGFDEAAKFSGVDNPVYHGSQGITDAAQLALGTGVANAATKVVSKIPVVTKAATKAAPYIGRVKEVVDKALPAEDMVGKVARGAVEGTLAPKNVIGNVGMTANYTGQNASKGHDTNLKEVGQNFAMGEGLGGAVGIASPLIKPLLKGGSAKVSEAGQAMKQAFDNRTRLDNERGFIMGPGASPTARKAGVEFTDPSTGRKLWEGSDEKMRFNPDYDPQEHLFSGQEYPLGQVIDHPELFKAYPGLKDMPVRFDENLPPGTQARYNGPEEGISINANEPASVGDDLRSLIHEITHDTQRREGLPHGGDESTGRMARDEIGAQINDAKQNPTVSNFLERSKGLMTDGKNQGMSQATINQALKHLEASAPQEVQDFLQLIRKSRKLKNLSPYELYRNLHGESYAFATEKRMNMTPEERAADPITDHVAPPDQILTEHGDAVKRAEEHFGKVMDEEAAMNRQADPSELWSPSKPKEKGAITNNSGRLDRQTKKAFIDDRAPILDLLAAIDRKLGKSDGDFISRYDRFDDNSHLIINSNVQADQYLRHSDDLNEALQGLGRDGRKRFDDYSAARTELASAKAKGGKYQTSRPINELRDTVSQGHGEFGSRFDALNRYYKGLVDVLEKHGVIDGETAKHLKSNKDYARIQRDMSDLVDHKGQGSGVGLSGTVSVQKRFGSKRTVLSPTETAAWYTQQVFREAHKNQTAQHLVDTLEEGGMATKLVDSGDVKFRREVWKFLKDTREGTKYVERLLKTKSKQLRVIQGELDKLNKKGLQRSLVRDRTKNEAPILSGNQEVLKGTKRATNPMRDVPKISGTVGTRQFTRSLTTSETRKMVENLINLPDRQLERIKAKIASRDPKAAELFDQVTKLRDESEAFRSARGEAWRSAMARADASTKNKNTISFFRNGVKEVFEVPKDIKEAAGKINPINLGTTAKIISAPGRLVRAGITGLNPIFIARNYVKDEVDSLINSEAKAYTHDPRTAASSFGKALGDALGIDMGPEYKHFLEYMGDATSYDLSHNQASAADVVNRLAGGKKEGVLQAVKSPVRSLERLASVTERATRNQNFRGAYTKAIEDGLSHDQAIVKARIAARRNSVDFAVAGEWGRVMNMVFPYWNPATQGARQVVRTFKNHPVTSTAAAVATVGIPLAVATAWNTSDPDRRAVYDNIPEYEKQGNLVVVPDGAQQNQDGTYDVVKVPLPPGVSGFFQPFRRIMEAYNHDHPVESNKVATDILSGLSGPIQVNNGVDGALSTFIPQGAKPYVQAKANKDFFSGKQTVPDYMLQAKDANGNPIPKEKQAYKFTSGTAQQIGDKLHVSPLTVQKFIKDTTGTVGLQALNAVDSAQAKLGTISKEKIGGESIPAGFKRSFAKADGKVNNNMSDGARYFANVKVATEHLNSNETAAWQALHPSKSNFLGEQIYEKDAAYNPAAKVDIYNRFPRVFEADKKLNDMAVKQGQPSNPLFSLTTEQRKKLLEKQQLPPGATDPELSNLYKEDWYQSYQSATTSYFDKVEKSLASQGKSLSTSDNPYPTTPSDLQSAMDTYNSLPKGTGARSAWIRSNPDGWQAMQDHYAAIDNWQNNARAKRGLASTEGAQGEADGYTTTASSGSSGSSDSSGSSGYSKSYKNYGGGSSSSKGSTAFADAGRFAVQTNASGKAKVIASTPTTTKVRGKGGKSSVKSKKIKVSYKKA